MSDLPVEACVTCGAGPVEKLLFPVAVHFKGSGFYSTDYGRSGRKGAKDSSDGTGGEQKPAEKAEKSTADTKKPAAESG